MILHLLAVLAIAAVICVGAYHLGRLLAED